MSFPSDPSLDPARPNEQPSFWSTVPSWYAGVFGGLVVAVVALLLVVIFQGGGDDEQVVTATVTPEVTVTPSPTPAATSTAFAAATVAASTPIPTATAEPIDEPTVTPTAAPSSTPRPTPTPRPTATPKPGATPAPTATAKPTATVTPRDVANAVWPWAQDTLRFADPQDAAESFARDFIGFTDPIIGEFSRSDSTSGEVEIRVEEDGPATVVFLRQLGDESWWVLSATSDNIVIDEPDRLAVVADPLRVSGSAKQFAGDVEVQLRQDGSSEPLLRGSFISNERGPLPFSGEFSWFNQGAGRGAVVLLGRDSESNAISEATVIRVTFAPLP